MAKIHFMSEELREALAALGIPVNDTTRVVIDIAPDRPVHVYTTSLGDERLLEVVHSLGEVQVQAIHVAEGSADPAA